MNQIEEKKFESLSVSEIVSLLDGPASGPNDFERKCRILQEQMYAYAYRKSHKAFCAGRSKETWASFYTNTFLNES